MNKTLERLEEIRKYGYALEFGTALDQTVQNYKKIIWIAGLLVLVLLIIFYVAVFFGLGVLMGIGSLTSDLTDMNPNSASFTQQLISLVVSIIGTVILAPLFAGIINMAHLAETHKPFSFSTPFEMYQSRFVREIIFSAMLIAMVTQGLNTLMVYLSFSDGVPMLTWQMLLGYVISLLITLLTMLSAPMIIFGELKAVEAIKASILVVSKRFWVILFLVIVLAVAATIIGLMALCIGVLFTAPVFYSLNYIIYRTAMPIEEVDEVEEIGRNSDWV